jgi:hypothetical protein
MPEPLFALLQTRHHRIDPSILRDVLMQDAGMPKVDAVRTSQKARGILADRLTHKQAEACRASLARQQIGTFVLPAEKVAPQPRPPMARWLGTSESGLFVPTDYHGGGGVIPWSSVFVISSGLVMTVVEERVPTEVWEGNSHDTAMTTKWDSRRKEELHHITEILGLSDAGQLLHFRLAAPRLHAQQVPQGGAGAPRFQKYLLLLDDVVAGATQAEISPETREILTERREKPRDIEGKKGYVFDERGYDAYNRWLFQLFMLREQGKLA